MTMPKSQFIKAMAEIITRLQALKADLEGPAGPPPAEDLGKCPIHNIPWRRTRYGIAHPPGQEGGKWCNKDAVDKLK